MAKKTPLTFQQRVGPEPKPKKSKDQTPGPTRETSRMEHKQDEREGFGKSFGPEKPKRKKGLSSDHINALGEALSKALAKAERKKKK